MPPLVRSRRLGNSAWQVAAGVAVKLRQTVPIAENVIADARLNATRSIAGLQARFGVRAWLVCLVSVSALVRSLVAVVHLAPSYFPDEYIYSSLARSLAAHGRPLVRGGAAHFPALIEPLLAAPLWAVGSTETAYHLVQLENAFLVSLAAIPAYLLARRLDLGAGYALGCAAFALAVPDLAFSAFIVSDPIAYPVVLTALYAGVASLQAPGRRAQSGFVALVALAVATRLQFVVLAPAFVVAALILDRRASFRIHRLPFAVFAVAASVFAALGPSRLLGYYAAAGHLQLNGGFFRWVALDLLFLSFAGGVALAPGAVAGLLAARGRRDRAFVALVVPFSLAVMAEAAVYASNGSDRFKERYLFVLLPLLPLAFGLYLRRARAARVTVTALAVSIAVGAAMLPLSGYVKGAGFDDSPLLWCFMELQWRLGATGASLLVAGCAVGGAGLAAAAAWTRFRLPAFVGALVLALSLSAGASSFDISLSKQIRRQLVAATPSWVDAAGVGPVSAIETDLAPASALLEQLFWNRSIEGEFLLGSNPSATDPFATTTLRVAADGTLLVPDSSAAGGSPGAAGTPIHTALLFQGFKVSVRFAGATPVARFSSFTLWRPRGAPRLTTYELGRYWDGWLAAEGGLEVWTGGAMSGTVSFTLSLPRTRSAAVTIRFGSRTYRLDPGARISVRIPVRGTAWSTQFSASAGASRLADRRSVSVRSTLPLFTPDER